MKLRPIKDKKKIDVIFEKGTLLRGNKISIKFYNFNDNSASYGLAVPKKNIPLANKRNLIKRRLRAIVSKSSFPKLSVGVSFFILYNSKMVLTSSEIESALKETRSGFINL
tara:strand:+ start:10 stop:342 length:333 start_codon:yes stop_codon:yes gene_type:complete